MLTLVAIIFQPPGFQYRAVSLGSRIADGGLYFPVAWIIVDGKNRLCNSQVIDINQFFIKVDFLCIQA